MSFKGIHKKTGKEYDSFLVWTFGQFINPKDEDWEINPDIYEHNYQLKRELKKINLDNVPAILIKSYKRKGLKYKTEVFSHFKVNPYFKKKINFIFKVRGESKIHKMARALIYALHSFNIVDDEIDKRYVNFEISKDNKIKYKNLIENVSDVIQHCEKSLLNNEERNIADVLIQFKEKDSLFGIGIVFEIQFSSMTEDQKNERTKDWLYKGYTIIWLFKEDFSFIEDDIYLINYNISVLPWVTHINKILEQNKVGIREDGVNYRKLKENSINDINELINIQKDEINYIFSVNKEELQIKYDDYINKINNKTKDILDIFDSDNIVRESFKKYFDEQKQIFEGKMHQFCNNKEIIINKEGDNAIKYIKNNVDELKNKISEFNVFEEFKKKIRENLIAYCVTCKFFSRNTKDENISKDKCLGTCWYKTKWRNGNSNHPEICSYYDCCGNYVNSATGKDISCYQKTNIFKFKEFDEDINFDEYKW